ncbi:MAG: asparagine synthase (glutamine-hydrolyzing) [Clostridia bacterium]|nr:asparagine synthase (glutamine-hydrolyzing) [Clostridia bacterium]
MCGFVGFINNTDDRAANLDTIKAMADRIAHRGPDMDDYYVDGSVSLGFRRLSIIDLEGGSQPIYNEDGTKVLVFNGEIYNFAELREELIEKGHIFKTKTDSEVILHGYEEYGPDFAKRLRGMFAFCIWDTKEKKLFAARDIFGIKPLFYYDDGESLLFASEIKAFLANPYFKKELNRDRIPEYLCFEYIPCEQTLFKNVYKLDPGSCLEWQAGSMKKYRYFDLKYHINDERTLGQWEEIIEETFKGSTAAHSIADVEVGCFLSSGVDSSYVVREMSRHNKVKTFSVGFEEEKYSELKYAEEFAKTVGVDFFTKKISADEYFDVIPKVQYYMDEPLPNPSAIALYFLARLASEQVKVVLSGEGADELFGGYYYYQDPLELEKYQKLPLALRRAAAAVAKKMPVGMHGRRFLIRGAQTIDKYYIRNNYNFTAGERPGILSPDIPAADPSTFTKPYFDRCAGLDDVTRMQYVDINTWLVQDILVKADSMSMAHSLELRVPFLDREMLDVAVSIPTRYRVTKELTKVALRGAAGRELPEKTAKMKKMGFPVPLNDWLRQDKYYSMVKEKFEGEVAAMFFNKEAIMRLLDDHRAGAAHNMKRIWTVYCFILWYEDYFVNN